MKTPGLFIYGCLLLAWAPVLAQTSTFQGLQAEYFNGIRFDRKVLARVDPAIQFEWVTAGPAPGVYRHFFSVRWSGYLLAPTSGIYRFSVTVDDGIRLWINNQLVIDAWDLHDNASFQGQITLTGGQYYALRAEYFNAVQGGHVRLSWQPPFSTGPPTESSQAIPRQYLTSRLPRPPQPISKVIGRSNPKLRSPPVSRPRPTQLPSTTVNTVPKAPVAPHPVQQVDTPVPALDSLSVGQTITLPTVQFEQSQYRLLPASYPVLDELVRALRHQPTVHLRVEGHTDNVGEARLNQSLSENRAQVVVNYLINCGISVDRLSSKGYGGRQPITDNATESTRAVNRRVAITVIK